MRFFAILGVVDPEVFYCAYCYVFDLNMRLLIDLIDTFEVESALDLTDTFSTGSS